MLVFKNNLQFWLPDGSHVLNSPRKRPFESCRPSIGE